MFSFDDESEFKIWLDAGYLCPGCGCAYRHLFKVRTPGDGEEEAIGRARRTILRKGLADIPCPDCGRVTAPHHRSRNPRIAAAFAAAAFGVVFVGFLAWKLHLLKLQAGAIAAGSATIFAVAFMAWLLLSRNTPSAARAKKARELIDAKRLHSVKPDVGPPQLSLGSVRESARAFAAVLLGVVILILCGIGLPLISEDYNHDVIPGFVSPGDEVSYTFPESLVTVKGHWRGEPRFDARTEAEPAKPLRIQGEGRRDRWPEEFFVKSHEQFERVKPSVRFHIPAQERLEGQTIDLTIRMDVEYPKTDPNPRGRDFSYHIEQQSLDSRLMLRVVSTETANRLKAAWWVAFGLAAVCITVPPLVVAIRAWQARQARYVLDLETGTPPAKPLIPKATDPG